MRCGKGLGGEMTKLVRGPFIEFECVCCGVTVQENAPRNPDRLVDRIAEANANASTRVCASCAPTPQTRT